MHETFRMTQSMKISVNGHAKSSRSPSFLTPTLCFGVPKTTLRLNNLLKGLTELINSIILTVTVYYSKSIHIDINRAQESPSTSFRCLLPEKSFTQCLFFTTVSDNTHGVLPNREAHPSLEVQNFYWGLNCIDMADCSRA